MNEHDNQVPETGVTDAELRQTEDKVVMAVIMDLGQRLFKRLADDTDIVKLDWESENAFLVKEVVRSRLGV